MATTRTAQQNGRVNPALATPTDLPQNGVAAICAELRQLLADVFALPENQEFSLAHEWSSFP